LSEILGKTSTPIERLPSKVAWEGSFSGRGFHHLVSFLEQGNRSRIPIRRRFPILYMEVRQKSIEEFLEQKSFPMGEGLNEGGRTE